MSSVGIFTSFSGSKLHREDFRGHLRDFFPWAVPESIRWFLISDTEASQLFEQDPWTHAAKFSKPMAEELQKLDAVIILKSPLIWPWTSLWDDLLKNPPGTIKAYPSKVYSTNLGKSEGSVEPIELPIKIYSRQTKRSHSGRVVEWSGPIYDVDNEQQVLELIQNTSLKSESVRVQEQLESVLRDLNSRKSTRSFRPAIFLDRDGVLIEFVDYLSDPKRVKLNQSVLDFLVKNQNKKWPIVVTTNQSGVGRGFFCMEHVHAVHKKIDELLAQHGLYVSRYYVAPYITGTRDLRSLDLPSFRKPFPGMFFQAALDLDINLEKSVMLGDRVSDLQAAQEAGIQKLYRVLDADPLVKEPWDSVTHEIFSASLIL